MQEYMNKVLKIALLLVSLSPFLLFGQKSAQDYARHFTPKSGISEQIQARLDALAEDPGHRIGGDKMHNIEYLTNLYHKSGYQPFWTDLAYAEDALEGILMSYADGLTPADYHLSAIQVLKSELSRSSPVTPDLTGKAAELELLLTDGVLFFGYHLLYGKADQFTLVPTFNFGFTPLPDANPVSFRESITNRDVTGKLSSLRPAIPIYDTLMAILAAYREIQSRGGWQPISTGGKIEPGDSDNRIPQVRRRLMITRELTSKDTSALYDKELEKDVKRFQSAHGLDADGVIGAGTFRELNTPVEKRIETIRVNMERVRWVSRDIPQSYIIVNIAGFWLTVVRDQQVIHRTNVVVGRPLNKTPIFRDKVQYIDFNPTWTVPRSIITKEIIPKLKRDSLYLQHNNMILLDSKGNEVSTSSLDFANLSAAKFPYLVRQQPGPDNALGVVKFMFPNDYDIYLHDTPSKSLFSKASRAYSHGCIRVENPLDLAAKLLEGTEWTREKINATVKTRQTTRVNLKQPLDILLMYWTCGLNPGGEIFFAPDIYDRDGAVLKQLNQLLR
jgi:murein L,D-transpeptidase YcbB/YkuD